MSQRTRVFAWSAALLAQLVFGIAPMFAQAAAPAAEAAAASDDRGIEVITVTARRKEENIQDIPIAVSAFSADDLSTSNIDDVADVQFNVPNLSYTKTNFSGAGNISIRGVGNLATAATAENGTGIHINDAPFPGSRIYETEFYDVGSVQVLRGPQGTLFGRSSPGGAVNVYTKKPVLEEWGGYMGLEYGDYNHTKVKAALNVPLGEHFGARAAGFYYRRDGITEVKQGKFGCVGVSSNCPGDDEIDGRSVYAMRLSLYGEWDDASFNLMGQYFRADDDRMRINNQGCVPDPQDWPNGIGCLGGNNKIQPGGVNYNSTLGYSSGINVDTGIAAGSGASRFLSGPRGIMTTSFLTAGGVIGTQANARFLGNPCVYQGGNTGICPGYLFDNASGTAAFGATPEGYGLPNVYYTGVNRPSNLRDINTQLKPRYVADELQITFTANFDITEDLTLTAVTGWHQAYVKSETDYWWGSPDVGFTDSAGAAQTRTFLFPGSDLGGQYGSEFVFDRSQSTDKMFTQEIRVLSSFDGMFNFQAGAIYNNGTVDALYNVWATSLEAFWTSIAGGALMGLEPDSSYYKNETTPTTLQSYALFGETYFDLTDTTRLTLGLRYTDDKKTDTQRVNLWTFPRTNFATREGGWTEVIWKVSLDQHFDLPWAPGSLAYITASTGYKGGGFNPAVDVSQSGGTAGAVPLEFKPETITAYEIGYKGTWWDQMQLGLTAFYYDYQDMQIGKIVNRTAVNENLDSKIWGVEVESVWQATESLRFDMNVSWLQSEIQKGVSIDGADPTNGVAGWMPIKQLLEFPAGQNAICNPAINPYCLDPVVINGGDPAREAILGPTLPVACQGIGNLVQGTQCGYIADGFAANLKGNELPNASDWTMKIGAQYALPAWGGWVATPRVDFYWRSEMFSRVYNTAKDVIPSWQQLDANFAVTKEGSPWMFELWAKNLQDNNDVTGHYFTDPTSANFTNLFLLEPRTFGGTIRYTWGESEY
ncbi:MAG TPA: TonB-dependent receptor [Myxococcota bacterium]|jgi:outer membrane receptor protein involved in Fe transport